MSSHNSDSTTGVDEYYDSKEDTEKHMWRVQELLRQVRNELEERGLFHDLTKLSSSEKPVFDKVTPRLKKLTYASEEYKASLEEMKGALEHHYKHNSHHPEYYPDGVNDMCLLDLIEMLLDWKAASERHEDGDIYRSIELNSERFALDDVDFPRILRNTIDRLFESESKPE